LQRYCLFLNWQAFLQTFFQKFFERKPFFGVIRHNTNTLGSRKRF